MFQDILATFSDAQSSTISAAFTDYISTVSTSALRGNAYVGCFAVARVDTSFAATGVTTCTFQLQTSDDANFLDSTTATLAASSAFTAAQLTAGKMWAVRIPSSGMKKYLRMYKVMSANTGGNFWTVAIYDGFIVADIDVGIDNRYLIS